MKILLKIVHVILMAPLVMLVLSIPVILAVIFSGWEPPKDNGISESMQTKTVKTK